MPGTTPLFKQTEKIYIDHQKLRAIADTFLVPYKLVANTSNAKVVDHFSRDVFRMGIRTERLLQ